MHQALRQLAPRLRVQASNVRFLAEPKQFYQAVCDGIRRARRRISLAALYVGTGQQEQQLVQLLATQLRTHPSLQLHVHQDCVRALRHSPGSDSVTSVGLLLPLLRQSRSQVQLTLYHTPKLRGIVQRLAPPRWNETLGVQHAKAVVIDDDVLITGANLSDSYFTDRQDRYVCIADTPALAQHMHELVHRLGQWSYQVDLAPHGSTPATPAIPQLPASDGGDAVLRFVPAALGFPSHAAWSPKYAALVRASMLQVAAATAEPSESEPTDRETWIYPTLQMHDFGIAIDEEVTQCLLRDPARHHVSLSSPYFNIAQGYQQVLQQRSGQLDVVTTSPQCHGFAGAAGFSGNLPAAYSSLEAAFVARMQRRATSLQRLRVFEFQRAGWTFHAKGLWAAAHPDAAPDITLVGSSNFGERSCRRDVEAQLAIVTSDADLQAAMAHERDRLFADASEISPEALAQRQIKRWIPATARAIRSYL